jgi:hydroxypyruvate isomerase
MVSIPSMLRLQQSVPIRVKGQIKQSVSRWCYEKIRLEELCVYGAQIGLKAIDLLNPDEYIPGRHGLVCRMAYAGGGEIGRALNRVENHGRIEDGFRKNIPLAAKAGVPNMITFSGNRGGMSEEGAKKHDCRAQSREENCRGPRLHGIAEQQGEPQGLHVR